MLNHRQVEVRVSHTLLVLTSYAHISMTGSLLKNKHPLTAHELAIHDLSGLARCAIFHAISKLHERSPRFSLESSSESETTASSAEAAYSVLTFYGRTPELLDLLHDVVGEFEKINIYSHDEAEHLLESE